MLRRGMLLPMNTKAAAVGGVKNTVSRFPSFSQIISPASANSAAMTHMTLRSFAPFASKNSCASVAFVSVSCQFSSAFTNAFG